MQSRGPYAKGIAKRQEILNAALGIFAERGYQRTSLRALAKEVNLTEAGLLHYFDSKEHLFAEILRTRDDVARANLLRDGDYVAALATIMRHNADVPGLVALYARLSSEAATDPGHAAHRYFRERYERLRGELVESLRKHQCSGSLDGSVDLERTATLLLAAADGLQIQWMLDPSRDMAEHIEFLWSLIRT